MTIGIDLRLFGSHHGGIGRYCKELFSRLIKQDIANQYVCFYNPKTTTETELGLISLLPNVTMVPTRARHYSLAEQTTFLRLLNKYNLDLVHFPNFNVPLYYKKPFVVTIHDMVHHKISGAKKSHLLHFYAYKKVIEAAAKNSQKIITVSQASKNDIMEHLGIAENKIKVIYEGSSLNNQIGEDKIVEVKKRYVINRPYFLFVGVLERKKNLVSLTRGFDVLIKQYGDDMDFVIVGKTDYHYPEIKHSALDIKNSDRLIFTGQVQEWELEALYKGAYAFVSASLHEGFGLPGLEALAFGQPLLVSNTPVFNEIYDNAAVYFNPLDPNDIAEKMHLLARDNQFRNQLGIKSIARSQMFNWETTAQETLQIYKDILKA